MNFHGTHQLCLCGNVLFNLFRQKVGTQLRRTSKFRTPVLSQSPSYQTFGYPFTSVAMYTVHPCIDRFAKVTLYSVEVNWRGTLRNEGCSNSLHQYKVIKYVYIVCVQFMSMCSISTYKNKCTKTENNIHYLFS